MFFEWFELLVGIIILLSSILMFPFILIFLLNNFLCSGTFHKIFWSSVKHQDSPKFQRPLIGTSHSNRIELQIKSWIFVNLTWPQISNDSLQITRDRSKDDKFIIAWVHLNRIRSHLATSPSYFQLYFLLKHLAKINFFFWCFHSFFQ